MRTMKAIVTGMSAATLAMIMACGLGTTADAAGTATFDATAQTMKVSGDTAEVLVSFDAIKVAKSGVTWNAKAKWDVYDGGAKAVDLSELKVAKDIYIAVKDNDAKALPKVYHLSPDTTKLAGKYEVADKKSKLTFTDNKNPLTPVTDADEGVVLEYRTANASTWEVYDSAKFPMSTYEQQGATLYFRKQAKKIAFAEVTSEEAKPYELYEVTKTGAGYFATAEVKVKITKMANAPAATINYDQGTFTIKSGTEYRLLDAKGNFVTPKDGDAGDFTAASTDKTTAVAIDVSKDGTFEVRTAADKKVASKIAIYAYKGVATPEATDVAVDPATGSERLLNLTYGEDKKKNAQVTFSSTNENASYVIYAVDPTDAANAKAKPIATLKKKGEKGYKDVIVGVAKLANDTTLYIMTASDKKNEVFRSKALDTIKVAYPAAPAPTAAPTAAPTETPE